MKEISHHWLSLVKQALQKANLLPHLEETFPLPWNEVGQAIKTALQLESFFLSPGRTNWRDPERFLQNMGENLCISCVVLTPIEEPVFLILSQQNISHLIAEMLPNQQEGFSSPLLQKGFYQFIILKIIQALDQLKVFKSVSLQSTSPINLPEEKGFCIDISCHLPKKTLEARMICSKPFLETFKKHQPFQEQSIISFTEKENQEVLLRAEVGFTTLSQDEFDRMTVGDFIILDRCSYDPHERKGSILMCLENTPLFLARVKPEGIKVLDYALYTEEEASSPPSSLNLRIEVGRLKMSLEQLIHVIPNKLLYVPMHPDQNVQIFKDNHPIATGELMKLGESIGVKILNINK